MAPAVPEALIATEDRRFYEHWGMDLRGFAAVALQARSTAASMRGASTITMQLARNLYREVGRERSIVRKAKEILTAIRIERTYTKDEILEAYLNTVPFLYNAYGIEAASQTYFGKHAADLNAPEAATLVGMLAANTAYDPVRNPEASRERRNIVLANMLRSGDLTQAAVHASPATPPIDVRAFLVYDHANNLAPHFSEVLRLWFKEWCEENGYDPYKDGLVIRTTIDSQMQALATQAVREQGDCIQRAVGGYQGWWSRNTAIVNEYIALSDRYGERGGQAVERQAAPRSTRASSRRSAATPPSWTRCASRGHASRRASSPSTPPRGRSGRGSAAATSLANKFDHVGQARRQAGLHVQALRLHDGLQQRLLDAEHGPRRAVLVGRLAAAELGRRLRRHVTLARGARREPQRRRGTHHEALRAGRDRTDGLPARHPEPARAAAAGRELYAHQEPAAVRANVRAGPDVRDGPAGALGARVPALRGLENDCYARSIALGTADVNLLEMAVGYATVADYGVYHGPTLEEERPQDPSIPPHIVLAVARIEDRYGNVVADFTPVAREVLNASTAYTMFDAMRGVISAARAAASAASPACWPSTSPARPARRRRTPTAGSWP